MQKTRTLKREKLDIQTLLAALFFIACWAMAAVMAWRALPLLDGDTSSDMVFANLLAQQNRLLTADWYYSTELHVLNSQLIRMPLFKIFSDWQTVRLISALLLQGCFVLSYAYLARRAKMPLKHFFLTAGMLLLPQSVAYARYGLMHGQYIVHTATAFALLGLFLGVVEPGNIKKPRRIIRVCAFVLMNFVAGLGGVRQPMILQVPLFLVTLLLAAKPFLPWAKDQEAKKLLATPRGMLQSTGGRAVVVAAAGLALGVAGYVINAKVLARTYTFMNFGEVDITNINLYIIRMFIDDLLSLSGFKSGYPILSIYGITSLLSGACLLFVLCYAVYWLVKSDEGLPYGYRVFSVLFLVTLALSAVIFLFTGFYCKIYFIPVIVYIPVLMVLLLRQCASSRLLRYAPLLLIALFAVNGALVTDRIIQNPPDSPMAYDGINSYSNPHLVEEIGGTVDFLSEEGYTFGYTSFWYANVITEMTDGRIECAFMTVPQFQYHNWLTKRAYQQPDYHQGKIFLILSQYERELEDLPSLIAEGELLYEDAYFSVYGYAENAPVYNYLNRADAEDSTADAFGY